ncbi:hypothetical protein ACIRON_25240 [Nocardioides sp. NPDC101246]|uniref:hypothetical protein n=1 Tax=Nocardioides sp. NPDC101246 TaxID=3364336 RepID=UPI0038178BBB
MRFKNAKEAAQTGRRDGKTYLAHHGTINRAEVARIDRAASSAKTMEERMYWLSYAGVVGRV